MKHTSPQFWQYAFAYIAIGSGTLAILATVADWALEEKQWSSLIFKEPLFVAGPPIILIGVMWLTNLKRLRSKDSAPDNTEDEN